MLRTLTIISNQIMLSFSVLIAFLSPKQSKIEESSLESISKTRMQGVWAGCQNDVARLVHFSHSTRMTSGILLRLHSTRVGISIRLPPLYPDDIRNYAPPPFHWDDIRNSVPAAISPGCLTSGIQEPDGRGGRFNFSGYTYPDPLIALTRRVSQPFLHSAAVFS